MNYTRVLFANFCRLSVKKWSFALLTSFRVHCTNYTKSTLKIRARKIRVQFVNNTSLPLYPFTLLPFC